MLTEINVDALVGPTHHFGGLGVGNIASQEHAHAASRPRDAALEGLKKAALVASFGIPQFLILPPVRPRWDLLGSVGFEGSLQDQLEAAFATAPRILSAAFSSSFMWAANSATVSAAPDTRDGRTHLTPANLISSWHRASESHERQLDLQLLLSHCNGCVLHDPLPAIVPLRDEGAANHMRLCDRTLLQGIDLFIHGADEAARELEASIFSRQSRAAFEAIARRHHLMPERTFFLQQHPDAIAAGVFHNDVIATSHENLLLYHQCAFLEGESTLERIESMYQKIAGAPLVRLEISEQELPLADAVRSYFFNSQILTPSIDCGGEDRPRMVLICPSQCDEIATARKLIDRLLSDRDVPIDDVRLVSLGESMANGGGPACLRLRIPLAPKEIASVPSPFRLDGELERRLAEAIEEAYPTTLELKDFCDIEFVETLSHIPQKLKALTD